MTGNSLSLSLSLSHTHTHTHPHTHKHTENRVSWFMICHDSWMLHVWLGVHAWNQPYYRTCMFCYNWWKLHFFWICCVVLLHGNHSLPLISRIKEEIELHGLQSTVSVSPCSHLGGHKYAGNFIIYGSKINGEVTGHW